MPEYKYEGRDERGKKVSGQLTADDQPAALAELTRQGLFLTKLELATDIKASDLTNIKLPTWLSFKRVSARDLTVFCRQLAVLYQAGIPLLPALRAIAAQQSVGSPLETALVGVVDRLEAGESLALALREQAAVFPPILVNMVAAGEVGGSLDDALQRAGQYFEREHQLGQKIKAALTYPKFVAFVALAITWFMMVSVLPNFSSIFASYGLELPTLTRVMLALSSFLARYGVIVLGILFLLYLSFRHWARGDEGRRQVDKWALRTPVFGKIVTMNAIARFCRTLAVLTRSGVNVVTALRLTEQAVDNAVFAAVVKDATDEVGRGGNITPRLAASGVFPPIVVQMIAAGENSGSLDLMLTQVADFYDQDLAAFTEQAGKLIEPLVILFLAGLVGLIALSIALPMMQMTNIITF